MGKGTELFGESILLALKHEAIPLWRSLTNRERGMQGPKATLLQEVNPSERPWFGVVISKGPYPAGVNSTPVLLPQFTSHC